ncbi:MAG: hypothetical protein R3F33_14740 [Planctomycetota bacterium]
MRPTAKRNSSALIPILFIALFIYMVNRDKEGNTRANPRTESSRTEIRKRTYPDTPQGTQEKLTDSLAQTKARIKEVRREQDGIQQRIEDANRWLGEFKVAYNNTKNGGPWPVRVRSVDYNESELVGKVDSLLQVRKALDEQLSLKNEQIVQLESVSSSLSAKLDALRVKLEQQATERERQRLDDLAKEADSYLRDMGVEPVEAPSTEGSGSAVRSLEELVRDSEKNKAREEVLGPARQGAMNFLSDSL